MVDNLAQLLKVKNRSENFTLTLIYLALWRDDKEDRCVLTVWKEQKLGQKIKLPDEFQSLNKIHHLLTTATLNQ